MSLIKLRRDRKQKAKLRCKARDFDRISKKLEVVMNWRELSYIESRAVICNRDFLKVERFQICSHGNASQNCSVCQSLTFMLCRHRLIADTRMKMILTPDICKLICKHVVNKPISCHRCCDQFDEQYDCNASIYVDLQGVLMSGYRWGYNSDIDIQRMYFAIALGRKIPMTPEQFICRYRVKNVNLSRINLCNSCVQELIDNGEVYEE